MPVHNKEPHLERSIGSVLAQTFRDFELLLIDDASTDSSLDCMQAFVDERIRVFHRDSPGPGGYAARNKGIANARGDWVAFLDADDEWFPYHLEHLVELASEYPRADMLGCSWYIS
ncbi:MAG: glycosyltransferase family A protein [Arhodomonas sp.]|nr:glycosyltransferase family A protein [Arhodomonas sp.]